MIHRTIARKRASTSVNTASYVAREHNIQWSRVHLPALLSQYYGCLGIYVYLASDGTVPLISLSLSLSRARAHCVNSTTYRIKQCSYFAIKQLPYFSCKLSFSFFRRTNVERRSEGGRGLGRSPRGETRTSHTSSFSLYLVFRTKETCKCFFKCSFILFYNYLSVVLQIQISLLLANSTL